MQRADIPMGNVWAYCDTVLEDYLNLSESQHDNARNVQHSLFESGIPQVQHRTKELLASIEKAKLVGLLLQKDGAKDQVTKKSSIVERTANLPRARGEPDESAFIDTRFLLSTRNMCK